MKAVMYLILSALMSIVAVAALHENGIRDVSGIIIMAASAISWHLFDVGIDDALGKCRGCLNHRADCVFRGETDGEKTV